MRKGKPDIDPDEAGLALSDYALRTSIQLVEAASPYLFHRLLETDTTFTVSEMDQARAVAKERLRQCMRILDADFPTEWDPVLKEMAGDFTLAEWSEKIGRSPEDIKLRCRLHGVQPQWDGKT